MKGFSEFIRFSELNESKYKEVITFEIIKNYYNYYYPKAKKHFEGEPWKVKPTKIVLFKSKKAYGMAHIDGTIEINEGFIGTLAHIKLIETILHELTHLLIGIDHHHSPYFKRIFKSLMVGEVQPTEKDLELVKNNLGFKYRLLGYTKTKIYNLGQMSRKTKQWVDYDPKITPFDYKGDVFVSFKYVPYGDDLPENIINENINL